MKHISLLLLIATLSISFEQISAEQLCKRNHPREVWQILLDLSAINRDKSVVRKSVTYKSKEYWSNNGRRFWHKFSAKGSEKADTQITIIKQKTQDKVIYTQRLMYGRMSITVIKDKKTGKTESLAVMGSSEGRVDNEEEVYESLKELYKKHSPGTVMQEEVGTGARQFYGPCSVKM